MILKASTRGNAATLGRHLLNDRENDHVEVHEVRGFLSADVMDAMREHEGIAKECRSRQTLFSVSLSPPQHEQVGIDVFENAIAQIEERNGLSGQPRIIIFHEKQGRRHCHVAWSRIDARTMTVKPLPFYKTKCRDLAKEIFLEQGWELPRGFIDRRERDPRNFSLAEWQQCKRIGRDMRQLKMLALESWAISDSEAGFAHALEQRGLYLARGDRRSHVALTVEGEPFTIPKLLDKRTKEVRARLGNGESLRSVADTRTYIAGVVMTRLGEFIKDANRARAEALTPLDQRRVAMKSQHRTELQLTDAGLQARAEAENASRAARMRSGFAGLWQRLSGEYRRLREDNERAAWHSVQRDRAQRARLVESQLTERSALQQEIAAVRELHAARVVELHRDLVRQRDMQAQQEVGTLREDFREADAPQSRRDLLRGRQERRLPSRDRERTRDLGYER